MQSLENLEINARCPYCDSNISLLIDSTSIGQHYIEDCEVCCRPMTVVVSTSYDQTTKITLLQENEIP